MCIVSELSPISTLSFLTFRERYSGHDVRIKGETITGWCSDVAIIRRAMMMIDSCTFVFPVHNQSWMMNMRVAPLAPLSDPKAHTSI
jgi:hypothetical protein